MLRFVWLAAGRSDFTFVRLGIYVCAGAHREHGTGAVTATARAAAHTHPPTEAQSGAHTPNVTQRTIYRRVIATAGSATPSQCPEPGGLSAIPAQAARSVSVTRPRTGGPHCQEAGMELWCSRRPAVRPPVMSTGLQRTLPAPDGVV